MKIFTCTELLLDDGFGRIGLGCLWFKSLSSKLVVSLFDDDDNCLDKYSKCSFLTLGNTETNSWWDGFGRIDIWCCSESLLWFIFDVVVVVVVIVVVDDDDDDDDDWDKYKRLFCEDKNDCKESKLTLLKFTKLIGWIKFVLFCTSVLELFCTNGCVVVCITVLKFGVILDWFPCIVWPE